MHESRKISREMAMKAASALKLNVKEIRAALKSPKKTKNATTNSDEPISDQPLEKPDKSKKLDSTNWAGSKGDLVPVCVKCEEEGGMQCQGACLLFYHPACAGVKLNDEDKENTST